MDPPDWRAQMPPHIRQIKVNEIMNTLKLHESHGDDDRLVEGQKTAQSFEQKTYAGAASQEDYLQKISSTVQLIRDSWKTLVQPDSRQRMINKIMETLKTCLPFSGQEGLDELRKIAERFENKIYGSATSERDYDWKISSRILTMETRPQNTIANSTPSNFGDNRNGPSNTGSSARRAGGAIRGGERNAPGRQSVRKRKQPQWLAEFVTY